MTNQLTPCAVVVVAAGRGRRFGGPLPKQFMDLDGSPLVWHTLTALADHPLLRPLLPVIGPDDAATWAQMLATRPALPGLLPPVTGGAQRQDSVRLGLAALDLPDHHWVAVHDAARAGVPRDLLERLLDARNRCEAVIPVLTPADTVKQLDPQGGIRATLDRATLGLAQTPQVFRLGALRHAHARALAAGFVGTDDASLLEWLGQPVATIPGAEDNLKVTQSGDLDRLRHRLRQRSVTP
ncbi:MAG: 2-C-methyl-D-erythritol 4-phosphate cytidylyltransferase [Magnetococcus sp. WYHC-3]